MTPKGTRPRSFGPGGRAGGPGGGSEPDLMADMRRAMRARGPLDLLVLVSTLLTVVDPRRKDPFDRLRDVEDGGGGNAGAGDAVSLDVLVQSFREVVRPETTAMLAVIAEVTGDEVLRARLRREVAGRGHHLPEWVQHLDQVVVHRTVEMVHVLGDGDSVTLGVHIPPEHELSVAVYIDHNMGTLVKDAVVVPEPIAGLLDLMRRKADDPDTEWRDIEPADAKVRISEAVELAAITYPPFESDTWPACRPLVEWVTRTLPPGGTGYVRPEWTDRDRRALAKRFLASDIGARHRTADRRDMLDAILWFGTDYGPGDPLRWSPVAVEILLGDWVPRKIVAPLAQLAQAPDVLRDLVRFSHRERGIRPALTDQTLEAIERFEPAYQAAIRSPRPQGPAALLARLGVLDAEGMEQDLLADDYDDDLDEDDDERSFAEAMLDSLGRQVGGRDALMALTDEPLPDERVLLDRIPGDIEPQVRKVSDLCDRWCDEVTASTECRTACRRLLGDVAAGEPKVFRRRARTDTTAAAICWLVGSANRLFESQHGGLLVKDLVSWFGLASSPSQRRRTLLGAAGIADEGWGPVRLGPRYLVSTYRRWLIELRERYIAMEE